MFKMLCFACALATSTVAFAGQAKLVVAKQMHNSAGETAIRSARIELNAALANRDLKTMAKYWLPDVNTIGGDGSLWVGRDKNIEGFAKIFEDPNFVSGLRTPDKVEVATGGPKEAAETGVWEWRERVNSQVLTYSGRYLVMWQLVNEKWRIRSELYVTTGCTGGTGCQ
ncbi:MAG: nuclear transport factor 2 family protein [Gammaproteobacteria bacterium]